MYFCYKRRAIRPRSRLIFYLDFRALFFDFSLKSALTFDFLENSNKYRDQDSIVAHGNCAADSRAIARSFG